MSETGSNPMRRREFIQTGAAAAAATTLAGTGGASAAQAPATPAPTAKAAELPRRALGKTGVEVTIVNAGTWRAPGSLDRLLRYGFSKGVRYFDTAAGYHTEDRFKAWFAAEPKVRNQIFLVTKDHVRSPGQMINQIDKRLAALGTDYIDLLFFHGLGSDQVDWPKSKEMKEAAEAIKKTGKVKFVGFSTHDRTKAEQLQNAAEGGFVDAIMIAHSPWLKKDDPINRALDACYKRNIGLVSMKQMAGHTQVKNEVPELLERGLNTHQGLLTAIWSDERFSATCVTMTNTDQINQNVEAAQQVQAVERGRHPPAPRCRPGGRADDVRRLRRPLRPRRRHQGPPRRPDPVPHLPRAPRLPPPGPRGLRRALRGRARLARRRPRGRARGLPQQARLRPAPPRGRSAAELTWRSRWESVYDKPQARAKDALRSPCDALRSRFRLVKTAGSRLHF